MEKIKIKPREEHSFFDVKLLPRSEIKIKFSSRFRDSIFESYFLRSEISFLASKNHLFKLEKIICLSLKRNFASISPRERETLVFALFSV